MRVSFLPFAVCAVSLYLLGHSASAQVIVNGGFETALSGWTVNDPSTSTVAGTDGAFAHGGSGYAALGAFGLLGSLSQTLTTNAGQAYNLSFFLANDGSAPPNEFDVYWDGVSILSLTNVAHFGYTNYSFTNLVASGASTTLEFRYRNDDDSFRLDDVAVAVVPEISASSSALLGFACLSGIHLLRRKRRAA